MLISSRVHGDIAVSVESLRIDPKRLPIVTEALASFHLPLKKIVSHVPFGIACSVFTCYMF